MQVKQKLEVLRGAMKEHGIDMYIVPSADFHQSEYVGEFFKSRAFMSGFTGSVGTLIVTLEEAGLWADGRYHLQAENELKDSTIKVFKEGLAETQLMNDFIAEKLPEGGVLGFDGRVVSAKEGEAYAKLAESKNGKLNVDHDLIEVVWTDRPSLPTDKAFMLTDELSGESTKSKLARVREKMQEKNADINVIGTLDDIAWLYNIRGNDVAYNPVVLAYTIVEKDGAKLFVDENKLTDEIKEVFAQENVKVLPYNDIYDYVKTLGDIKVLIDRQRVNYSMMSNVDKKSEIIDQINPTLYMKAIKNETELENNRQAHIKDGVAITKFMKYLKENASKGTMTELSAEHMVEDLRKEQEGFIQPSFHSISAYGANAAMMHYAASETSNETLKDGQLYLIDSGGQYYGGTTDITRTYAIGEVSEELKRDFTLVVKGMVTLSMAKFLYGCRGYNLDILARGAMWKHGIDYLCGTGHGIGYMLNVHEAPNGFRWRIVPERYDSEVLEAGMVTTNEPGIYIDGSHGIRLENELVARNLEKNMYGQFMDFEVITFAPIDLDAIIPELLNSDERAYLNDYHAEVYEKLAPHLNDEEKEWLKKYTRSI